MRRTGSPRPPSSGPIAASSAVGDAAELLDAALDGATGAADAAQSGDYAKYTAAIRSGAIPTVAGTTGGRAVAGCSRTTCRGDCLYRVLNAVGIDDLTRIFNTTAKLKQKFKPRTGTGVVGGGGGRKRGGGAGRRGRARGWAPGYSVAFVRTCASLADHAMLYVRSPLLSLGAVTGKSSWAGRGGGKDKKVAASAILKPPPSASASSSSSSSSSSGARLPRSVDHTGLSSVANPDPEGAVHALVGPETEFATENKLYQVSTAPSARRRPARCPGLWARRGEGWWWRRSWWWRWRWRWRCVRAGVRNFHSSTEPTPVNSASYPVLTPQPHPQARERYLSALSLFLREEQPDGGAVRDGDKRSGGRRNGRLNGRRSGTERPRGRCKHQAAGKGASHNKEAHVASRQRLRGMIGRGSPPGRRSACLGV